MQLWGDACFCSCLQPAGPPRAHLAHTSATQARCSRQQGCSTAGTACTKASGPSRFKQHFRAFTSHQMQCVTCWLPCSMAQRAHACCSRHCFLDGGPTSVAGLTADLLANGLLVPPPAPPAPPTSCSTTHASHDHQEQHLISLGATAMPLSQHCITSRPRAQQATTLCQGALEDPS